MEVIVVVSILGIVFAIAFPALESLSPKYSLRSTARQIGTQINFCRSSAGGAGKTYYLHYDLDEQLCWIILPPTKEQDPDLELEERDRTDVMKLSRFVEVEAIVLPDGSEVDDGQLDLQFDPLGFDGSHIVYLRNVDNGFIAVKFNAILGVVDYFSEKVDFEEF